MKKQTQKKTNNSQKKRRNRLLAIWIPVGTVTLAGATAGIVLGVKSCNNGLNVVYVTQDENLGTFTVEGSLGNDTTITFSPKASYELNHDSVIVTVNDRNLTKYTDYTMVGNSIIIKAKAMTNKNIKIRANAKFKIPVPAQEITGINAVGFAPKVQGDTIKASDLTVTLTFEDGTTSDPLDYSKGEYKLQASYNAGEYEDVTLPFTCSTLGLYDFKVIYGGQEDITTTEVMTVVEDMDYTVAIDDEETSFTDAGIAATVTTTDITRKNSNIGMKLTYTDPTGKTNPKIKGRIVAYIICGDDKEQVGYSDYFELNTGVETETPSNFKITQWDKFVNQDTIYLAYESIPYVVKNIDYEELDGIFDESRSAERTQTIDNIDSTISIPIKAQGQISGYYQIWTQAEGEEPLLLWEDTNITTYQKDQATTAQIQFPLDKASLVKDAGKAEKAISIKFDAIKASNVEVESTTDVTITSTTTRVYDVETLKSINYTATTTSASPVTGSMIATYTETTSNGDETTYQVGIKTGVSISQDQPSTGSIEIDNWEKIPSSAGDWKIKISFISDVTINSISETFESAYQLSYSSITSSVDMANPTITISGLQSATAVGSINHLNFIVGYNDGSDFVEVGRTDNIDSNVKQDVKIKVHDWLNLTSSTALIIKAEEKMKVLNLALSSDNPKDVVFTFPNNDPTIVQEVGSEVVRKEIIVHSTEGNYCKKGIFTFYDQHGTKTGSVTKIFGGGRGEATIGVNIPKALWATLDYEQTWTIKYTDDPTFKQGYLSPYGSCPDGVSLFMDRKLVTNSDTEATGFVQLRSTVEKHVKISIKASGTDVFEVVSDAALTVQYHNAFTFTIPTEFWTNYVDRSTIIFIVEDLE